MAAQAKQDSFSSEAETLSHVMSLMEAFRAFDSNNDGLITTEELACTMSSLGYNLSGEETCSIMGQHDKNKDGLLSLTEFLDFNTKDMDVGNLSSFLRVAVDAFDMDADDDVTGDELFEVIRENGLGLPVTVCEQIIGSMDRDGDGAVSFEDFQIIVSALL